MRRFSLSDLPSDDRPDRVNDWGLGWKPGKTDDVSLESTEQNPGRLSPKKRVEYAPASGLPEDEETTASSELPSDARRPGEHSQGYPNENTLTHKRYDDPSEGRDWGTTPGVPDVNMTYQGSFNPFISAYLRRNSLLKGSIPMSKLRHIEAKLVAGSFRSKYAASDLSEFESVAKRVLDLRSERDNLWTRIIGQSNQLYQKYKIVEKDLEKAEKELKKNLIDGQGATDTLGQKIVKKARMLFQYKMVKASSPKAEEVLAKVRQQLGDEVAKVVGAIMEENRVANAYVRDLEIELMAVPADVDVKVAKLKGLMAKKAHTSKEAGVIESLQEALKVFKKIFSFIKTKFSEAVGLTARTNKTVDSVEKAVDTIFASAMKELDKLEASAA